jgi:hypothetical protein
MYLRYNLSIEETDKQKVCEHNWRSITGVSFYSQKSKFWECTKCKIAVVLSREDYFVIKGIVVPDLIWMIEDEQQRKEAEKKIKELV